MLYTAAVSTNTAQMRTVIQSLKSGEVKELFAGAGARYIPTGHIVYQLANNRIVTRITRKPASTKNYGPQTVEVGLIAAQE
jgi:hypothetical protein